MRITRDHAPWAATALGVTVVAVAIYALQGASTPQGFSGGSWPGLTFGVSATLCMLLAALLSLRKKLILWRLGSAQLWMKMHLWLGLLAVPLVLLHSGLGLGGMLTTVLVSLFAVVAVSGVVGLLAQHLIPTRMTARVPLETVYGQIEHVLTGLRVDAYEAVAAVAGAMPEAEEERAALALEQDAQARNPGSWREVSRQQPAPRPAPESAALRELYLTRVRPFLRGETGRRALPPDLFADDLESPDGAERVVRKLADLCEECAQLRLQQRLHSLLHGWLLVHAPLSLALLVLVAFHAVYALRY